MSLRPFIVLVIALITVALTSCGGNPRHVVASPRVDAPPPGMALVNFVYDDSHEYGQGIFNEKKELLFLLAPNSVHQLAITPGINDFYITAPCFGIFKVPGLDSVIRIHAIAGRIYDVNVEVTIAKITIPYPAHPGTEDHADIRKLITTLQPISPIDRTIPDIQKLETKYGPRIDKSLQSQRENPDQIIPTQMQTMDSRAP